MIEFTTHGIPLKLPLGNARREKGTIPIGFVREVLACMEARGQDPTSLLAQAGIAPNLLTIPQARVSSVQYGVLWHLVAEALEDEFLGMDSRPMKPGSFSILCRIVIPCQTLGQALNRALHFFGLILDDIEGELSCEAGIAQIRVTDCDQAAELNADPAPPKRAFAHGVYLIILHRLACWLVGQRIPLLATNFRCAEPPFGNEWRELFSPHLCCDQAWSGIRFPGKYLDMPNIQNEQSMKELLRSAPADFLLSYDNSASQTSGIRRLLQEVPPAQWPGFSALATQFNTSTATLRRRLQDEGQSFRSILDDLRRDLAISLLCHTNENLTDIAARLGFAESSAFHRAFKKWAGASPGEYRRNVIKVPDGARD